MCWLASYKESCCVWQQGQSTAHQAVGPPHGICTNNSVSLYKIYNAGAVETLIPTFSSINYALT